MVGVSRRTAFSLGAAALLAGRPAFAQTEAAPAPRGMVLVLNSGDATLSRLDPTTRAEIDRTPALREPHHIIRGPGDSGLIVADSGANEFLFVDPATGALRRRLRISNPYHLAMSPDGTGMIVLSLRRDQIDLYDTSDMRLVRRFAMPLKPSHPVYAPDGAMVFATLQGSGEVVAIDTATQELRWRSKVGREPAGIAWAPNGLLVAGIMGSDHVAVINPDDGRLERRIVTGRGAHAVFPGPGGTLFVTNRVAGTISVLDGDTLAERHRYTTPGGPDCLAFAPDGKTLWYTRRWSQSVGVLDLDAGEVVATIPVGRSPHGIFFSA